MDERFIRSERLFGEDGMKKLQNANVIVFGLGGVGAAATEALARSGIGSLSLVDMDTVDISNLNRQLFALEHTLGMKKTDAAAERLRDINPDLKLTLYPMFYLPETADEIDLNGYDYIIDCIDNVTAKIELCVRAEKAGVPMISSMGTGNKLHPEMLEIADIYKTSVCPLARIMRRELKSRGIKRLKTVYSKEEPLPLPEGIRTPGSTSFVPPVAGYIIAGEVIRSLLTIR